METIMNFYVATNGKTYKSNTWISTKHGKASGLCNTTLTSYQVDLADELNPYRGPVLISKSTQMELFDNMENETLSKNKMAAKIDGAF